MTIELHEKYSTNDATGGSVMPYVYYYRNRPPGMYVQPEGFDPDTREDWYPGKLVKTMMGGDRRFMGKVEYPEPLPHQGVWDFELWPADDLEWAKYQAWLEYREAKNLWLYIDYAEALADPEKAELVKDDPEGKLVTFLLKSGVDLKALEKEFNHAATS